MLPIITGRRECPAAWETRLWVDELGGEDVDEETDCPAGAVEAVDGVVNTVDDGVREIDDVTKPPSREVEFEEEVETVVLVVLPGYNDEVCSGSECVDVFEGDVEEASVCEELVCVDEGRRVTQPGSRQSVMFMPCEFVIVRS